MRSLPRLSLLPFVLLAVSACAPAEPETGTDTAEPAAETTTTDDAAVREAIQARIDAYEQAALAGDFQATKSMWSSGDVEIREPGVRVSGPAELNAFYDEIAGMGMEVSAVDIRVDEVFVHGDVAYTIGDYDETVQIGDGEPMNVHNYWFGRWERGADGSWTMDRLVVGAVDAPEGMGPPRQ